MKVDIVVNSMIQQIDRNLKTQVMPVPTFNTGEILRGRVMLTSDDRLQIRLDNGALLNALPTGDVQLSQGATVTLRVAGQMDGNFVMQLLEQELSTVMISGKAQQAGGDQLAKLGLNATPLGRAVLASMERMGLPLREETASRALEILGLFPELDADKAVFMAANRMNATRAQVNALNRLVDGHATTGGELLKLADILSSQALSKDNLLVMEDGGRAPSAEQAANPAGQAAAHTDAYAPQGMPSNSTGQAVTESAPAPQGMANASTPAQGAPNATVPMQDEPVAAAPANGKPNAAIPLQDALNTAAPAQGGQTNPKALQDGILRLQSLSLVALGQDAAERYTGTVAALAENGAVLKAVALALDGPFMPEEQLAGQLKALEDSLPKDVAKEAREFVGKLAEGVRRYMNQNGASALLSRPSASDAGMARVVKEIMGMFVPINGEKAPEDAGAKLASAAAAQQESVERLSSVVARAGAAGSEAARQMDALSGHVRLLQDISQYAYTQIPVQINGRNSTAEFYVLNRGKRGKKINPDSANMLIALDTEHMGRVETLASITRKNLRLRFGVERPGLMGYISSRTAELSEAMKEIGFRLSDVRTQVIGKPVNPLTVMQAVEPSGARSLDVKV